jgi:N-methylhydantoinase A
MRRRDRRNTWGLWGDFAPVVDRDLRLEVGERTLASGEIRAETDPEEVRAAARVLLAKGAEALAIVFINAYANPSNELAALAAATSVWPNENLSCSSQILPEIREFERTSTTVLNAYLQPVVGSYLARLSEALAQAKFRGSFHVVQSNGGVMSTATARRLPVRTALSASIFALPLLLTLLAVALQKDSAEESALKPSLPFNTATELMTLPVEPKMPVPPLS